jgi:hypothetical protein
MPSAMIVAPISRAKVTSAAAKARRAGSASIPRVNVVSSLRTSGRTRRRCWKPAYPAVVARDDPEPGDLLLQEREGGVVRLNHYFDEDEIRSLCADAGFDEPHVWHCSDLGEAFHNLYVVAATKRS